MDKFSVMNAYCRIVERGSFARAAEDLGVSGALLSREIKLLEQSLGCTLLTRTTRSMSPTAQGLAYYDAARDLLGRVARIDEEIRASSGRIQGHLRVNAPSSYGQIVIAPRLPAFMERHPDLTVTLSFDDHVIDMVEQGFDLSIRVRASLPDSTLFARPVAEVGQRLYAAPRYLDRAGAPQSPEALADHATLGFTLADHHRRWQLRHRGSGTVQDVAVTPRMSVGNSLVLRDLLIAGKGIGTLPDFVADPAVAAGTLLPVLPDHALPDRQIFAVTGARLEANAAAAAFVALLKPGETD
ncbi:LysR family transcriptional regulator [Salipiger sp. P9]|uniref:LysR family transcriptional regulator n=1 Tax=Salipiger pentaromativorans TaxID=2943193 RepID=UPI0021582360|nr:LysR family transcriptional regulator [Salipiger pentaromativorans]MCR8546866.1 LysR family transcriptional regulator [Salipiger pentaromativorans]